MIPEKGSLFLCDLSKIKEKHHVNRITKKYCFRITDMVTAEIYIYVTYRATQEERK